jgi:putative oxidoreductase
MTIRECRDWLMTPPVDGPAATALLRVMAGTVFFWEGIMKFIFTSQGAGRFGKLGFPLPALTAASVGVLEILGGTMLTLGWRTRVFAALFVCEMAVAMLSTKITMFLGLSPLALPPVPPQTGLWAVLHEIRSEYAQMFVSLFLVVEGPGKLSLDARRAQRLQ